MTFLGHGTLMFTYNNITIHIDPVSRYANYSKLPKADLILITHHHGDHLNLEAINHIKRKNTDIIGTETCSEKLETVSVMKNGDVKSIRGIQIEAVPAYNIVHKRESGEVFHPKGVGSFSFKGRFRQSEHSQGAADVLSETGTNNTGSTGAVCRCTVWIFA